MADHESTAIQSAQEMILEQVPAGSNDITNQQATAQSGLPPTSAKSVDYKNALTLDCKRHTSALKSDCMNALTELDKALHLEPKSTEALALRSVVNCHLAKYDAAIADCTEALRLDPQKIKLYDFRSRYYAAKGDFDKAIADQSEIIRLDPKSADAYKARGDLYAQQHKIDKAAADYATAERLKPSDDRYR
jgi:tetratricopeptide (TPR) repeat protein